MKKRTVRALVDAPAKVVRREALGAMQEDPSKALVLFRDAATNFGQAGFSRIPQYTADEALAKIRKASGELQNFALLNYRDDAEVNWQMGRFLHRIDKNIDALWHFEKALEADPTDTHVMARYAMALMDAHDDMPDKGYADKALQLAWAADQKEGSEFTASLVQEMEARNGYDLAKRMQGTPVFGDLSDLNPTGTLH